MRIVGLILLVPLALYGAGVAYLAYYQRHMIYPGVYDPPRQDRNVVAGTKTVVVNTSDGESLHALWVPPKPGCGVVLTFHGNGSLPEPHALRFASGPWREAGWGVLAIAYRGFPGSTGSPSEDGLIRDGLAAHAFVSAQAPDTPILLHGHSLGSAVAVAVAEKAAHLGLYLEAPFDSMSHTARLHFPYVPSGWFLRDTFRSDLRIGAGPQPIMIVAGDRDDIVPAKLSVRLARAAGARASIVTLPGDHVSILGLEDARAEAFFRKLACSNCGRDHAAH